MKICLVRGIGAGYGEMLKPLKMHLEEKGYEVVV